MSTPILRGQLRSFPANGHAAFIPQIRKLVFECCDRWPSSENTRTYLFTKLQALARENPHVEIVVRQRIHREPIVRGFYANNRDKVIPLNGLTLGDINQKVKLLLDSSGAKIKPLKRRNVESTTEATRGIWSGLHADRPTI
ncbi:putative mitochondrial ribosomal protein L51 / S25 / CI-B8 domain [Lyophyllum shimeji]|uniref:Large ribosomal subunit protein mL43 n=1 Tax=Lyophyllum shimeji TaxID=47721 RepID=A0A9P3PIF5_LYOSH|nr:putative mitochondrial ribosomal protein L51 / S25 / CI-B8 domain [Lyophyllum shimeji]